MASNMKDILSSELTASLVEFVSREDDRSTEDKLRIQHELIKVFGEVWNEVVSTYTNRGDRAVGQPSETVPMEEETSSSEDTEDQLYNAQIKHEGTLIAVTKKREKYPPLIAGYLGKTMRLKKNTAEVLQVDLSPRVPLEMDSGSNNLDDTFNALFSDTYDELSESTCNIQPLTGLLARTADAAEITLNNQNHPSETFIKSTENMRKYSM